jgi:hypothetical protein
VSRRDYWKAIRVILPSFRLKIDHLASSGQMMMILSASMRAAPAVAIRRGSQSKRDGVNSW